jgi:hypothetical protein
MRIFNFLFIAIAMMASCKTADKSALNDKVNFVRGEDGQLDKVFFMYRNANDADENSFCAIRCRYKETPETVAELLDRCVATQGSDKSPETYKISRANFTKENFLSFVSGNQTSKSIRKEDAGVFFDQLLSEIDNVSTVDGTAVTGTPMATLVDTAYRFVSSPMGQAVNDSSNDCDFKVAYRKAKPSVMYVSEDTKSELKSPSVTDHYTYSDAYGYVTAVPKLNWNNIQYRAYSADIAVSRCQELSKTECVSKGLTITAYRETPSVTPSYTDYDWDSSKTCLIGTTQIRMANGTTKSISDVKVGEEVLGYDAKAKKVVTTKVVDRMSKARSKTIALTFESGLTVRATPEHLFFQSKTEHVRTGQLLGEQAVSTSRISGDDGALEDNAVVSWKVFPTEEEVFNLYTASGNYLLEDGTISMAYE